MVLLVANHSFNVMFDWPTTTSPTAHTVCDDNTSLYSLIQLLTKYSNGLTTFKVYSCKNHLGGEKLLHFI